MEERNRAALAGKAAVVTGASQEIGSPFYCRFLVTEN